MTVRAATDIESLDALVVRIETAVTPPLGGSKDADDRRTCRDGEVCRPSVAADVDLRFFGKLVETFQGGLGGNGFTRAAAGQNFRGKRRFVRSRYDDRCNAELVPDHIREPAILFSVPKFRDPSARGIQNRKIIPGPQRDLRGFELILACSKDWKVDLVGLGYSQRSMCESEISTDNMRH